MSTNTAVEIERKYVIRMPDMEIVRSQSEHTESSILQIYLPHERGETHRIRRREYADKVVCTETRKVRLDVMSAAETENSISEMAFNVLAKTPLEGHRPIEKVRHTFKLGDYTYEIDVYPKWKNTAILEIELPSCDAEPMIPEFIEVILDVTGDRKYKNFSMSKHFPLEII
jgi:CYTH domain-containing protein